MIHNNTGKLTIALIAASMFLGTACGNRAAENKGTTDSAGVQLVNPGKLTVCTNVPFEPFQFYKDGNVVGFDVDIVDLAAKDLGVTQEIVIIDFALIKSGAALNSGKCDLAAAGMTITEERKQNIDFSDPYFDASQALMTRKDQRVSTLDEIKAKKLKIGALASTTGRDYVRSRGFDPVEFPDSSRQLLALQTGQVDVIIQDLPVVRTWLKKPEIAAKFVMVASLNTGERYGIAIRKGNAALAKVVNDAIESAKKDGSYTSIYKKWFDIEPDPAAP